MTPDEACRLFKQKYAADLQRVGIKLWHYDCWSPNIALSPKGYSLDDVVVYNAAKYKSLSNNNHSQPTDTTQWTQEEDNLASYLDDRIKTEYAYNLDNPYNKVFKKYEDLNIEYALLKIAVDLELEKLKYGQPFIQTSLSANGLSVSGQATALNEYDSKLNQTFFGRRLLMLRKENEILTYSSCKQGFY